MPRRQPAATAALEAEIRDLRAALTAQQETMRALEAALANATHSLTALCEAHARDSAQYRRLEQLLAGGAPARRAGAAAALAAEKQPVVAVILPTRDRAPLLGDAIESVRAQSLAGWELVIVDDASQDGTEALVRPYLADPRIRYIRLAQPGGAAAARNRGIAASAAPLLAYLDSDNLHYPDFLRQAAEYLLTTPTIDLVYGALVYQTARPGRASLLWRGFDRAALAQENYIDANVLVHRRTLVARHGGWDERLRRLLDWDLVRRYTAEAPARALPVLAACYREESGPRISNSVPLAEAKVAIATKFSRSAPRLRVLYALRHYPRPGARDVETEIARLLAWGVQVEIWRADAGISPNPARVPVHDGTLEEAVRAAAPDVIHVHRQGFANELAAQLRALRRPVTLRLHGQEGEPAALRSWLGHEFARAVFAVPLQLAALGSNDPRLVPLGVAYDETLFRAPPPEQKNRNMVLRAAALPSPDLALFFRVAQALPAFRFVLALAGGHRHGPSLDELRARNAALGGPVELRVDVPDAEMIALVAEAGIYLHTARSDEAAPGPPVSLAEAMACGAYGLARDLPVLRQMLGEAGDVYESEADAIALIAATRTFSTARWREIHAAATARAARAHASETVLLPMLRAWRDLAQARAA